jgi:hypothetical protein
MSVRNVSVLVPPLGPVPPGAAWIANGIAWCAAVVVVGRAALRTWSVARREAGARTALVAMARRYESSQPEFAKDLFAAATNERRR